MSIQRPYSRSAAAIVILVAGKADQPGNRLTVEDADSLPLTAPRLRPLSRRLSGEFTNARVVVSPQYWLLANG